MPQMPQRRRFGMCGGAQAAAFGSAGAGRVDVCGGRVDDWSRWPTGRARRSLAQYLRRAGRDVALVHSDESDAARTDAWRRAVRGDCVVVGGRTAALAPVPDLAAAIVVDDADEALQEERSPTWHARDVLLRTGARARTRRGRSCRRHRRSKRSRCPERRARRALAGCRGARLAPRRSWSTAARSHRARACSPSRWPRRCARPTVSRSACSTAAAAFASSRATRATRSCGGTASAERPMLCDECGATRLRVLRAGVARVREELEALFPRLRVLDVDAATAEVGEADIVIGTEAVLHRPELRRRRPDARRVHRPRPGVARPAVPRGGAGAVAHDARRAAARGPPAGRDAARSCRRVNPITRSCGRSCTGSPRLVTEAEAERRRALGFPPFGALAEVSGDDAAVLATIDVLRGLDAAAASVQVLGPTDGRALVVAPTASSARRRARTRARCRSGGRAGCGSRRPAAGLKRPGSEAPI